MGLCDCGNVDLYCMYFYGALDSISSILQLDIIRVSHWYAVLADESVPCTAIPPALGYVPVIQ